MTQDTNPWDLTAAQAAVVQVIVDHGCNKSAAKVLGLSVKTVEAHMTAARRKMRERNRVTLAVKWDRWTRSTAAGQGEPK